MRPQTRQPINIVFLLIGFFFASAMMGCKDKQPKSGTSSNKRNGNVSTTAITPNPPSSSSGDHSTTSTTAIVPVQPALVFTPPAPDLSGSRRIQEKNREIVSACLNSVANGKSEFFSEMIRERRTPAIPGKKESNPSYFRNDSKYWVTSLGDHIRLETRINLKPGDSETRAVLFKLFSKTHQCVERIREMWLRYNIEFDMRFYWDDGSVVDRDNVVTVNLSDSHGRSNSGHYYFRGQDSSLTEDEKLDEYCDTLSHEVGHTLGLNDEYYESGITGREFISRERNPHSFMANSHAPTKEFYPRHIRSILQSFCPAVKDPPHTSFSQNVYNLNVQCEFDHGGGDYRINHLWVVVDGSRSTIQYELYDTWGTNSSIYKITTVGIDSHVLKKIVNEERLNSDDLITIMEYLYQWDYAPTWRINQCKKL